MTESDQDAGRDIGEGGRQQHILPQFRQQAFDVAFRIMVRQLRRKQIGDARDHLVQDIAQGFRDRQLPHRYRADPQVADQQVQSIRQSLAQAADTAPNAGRKQLFHFRHRKIHRPDLDVRDQFACVIQIGNQHKSRTDERNQSDDGHRCRQHREQHHKQDSLQRNRDGVDETADVETVRDEGRDRKDGADDGKHKVQEHESVQLFDADEQLRRDVDYLFEIPDHKYSEHRKHQGHDDIGRQHRIEVLVRFLLVAFVVADRDETARHRVQGHGDDDGIVGHRIRQIDKPIGLHPDRVDDIIRKEEVDAQVQNQGNQAGNHIYR